MSKLILIIIVLMSFISCKKYYSCVCIDSHKTDSTFISTTRIIDGKYLLKDSSSCSVFNVNIITLNDTSISTCSIK